MCAIPLDDPASSDGSAEPSLLICIACGGGETVVVSVILTMVLRLGDWIEYHEVMDILWAWRAERLSARQAWLKEGATELRL